MAYLFLQEYEPLKIFLPKSLSPQKTNARKILDEYEEKAEAVKPLDAVMASLTALTTVYRKAGHH